MQTAHSIGMYSIYNENVKNMEANYENNQQDALYRLIYYSKSALSGFGGLEIARWPLVPKFAGSHPAETVGFLERKNPQHAFLWKGSKAFGPMP